MPAASKRHLQPRRGCGNDAVRMCTRPSLKLTAVSQASATDCRTSAPHRAPRYAAAASAARTRRSPAPSPSGPAWRQEPDDVTSSANLWTERPTVTAPAPPFEHPNPDLDEAREGRLTGS